MIKAIETRYKGCRFRSRLEARWAVFFDALDVEWRYEPEGFDLGAPLGCYLPDFYLPKFNAWAEVKPEIPKIDSLEAKKLWAVVRGQAQKSRGLLLGQIGESLQLGWEDLRIERPVSLDYRPPIQFLFDDQEGSVFGYGAQLVCPICANPNVLRGPVTSVPATTTQPHTLLISVGCRDWHKWEIEFSFYPAIARVKAINFRKRIGNWARILTSGDDQVLEAAFKKARSARFEHGETPE